MRVFPQVNVPISARRAFYECAQRGTGTERVSAALRVAAPIHRPAYRNGVKHHSVLRVTRRCEPVHEVRIVAPLFLPSVQSVRSDQTFVIPHLQSLQIDTRQHKKLNEKNGVFA